MKSLSRNSQGFAPVEMFLVLLTLTIIGVAGYLVAKHVDKKNTHATNSGTAASSQASSTYSGWKSYDWSAEGLSFKHPSTWTTNNPQAMPAEQANQPAVKPSDPLVFLFSPNTVAETGFDAGSTPNQSDTFTGDFAINATKDTAASIEQITDVGSPHGIPAFVYILKVIPLTVPGYKQLYIIEEGEQSPSYADELAITDVPVKVGLTNSTDDDSFQSKTTPSDRVSFTIGLFSQAKDGPGSFAFINMPTNTFEQLKDYNTALNILKSISY